MSAPCGDEECDAGFEAMSKANGGCTLLLTWGYEEGYGHHQYESVYRLGNGKFVHAECGGCSCKSSGSFSVHHTLKDAVGMMSETAQSACVPECNRRHRGM